MTKHLITIEKELNNLMTDEDIIDYMTENSLPDFIRAEKELAQKLISEEIRGCTVVEVVKL